MRLLKGRLAAVVVTTGYINEFVLVHLGELSGERFSALLCGHQPGRRVSIEQRIAC